MFTEDGATWSQNTSAPGKGHRSLDDSRQVSVMDRQQRDPDHAGVNRCLAARKSSPGDWSKPDRAMPSMRERPYLEQCSAQCRCITDGNGRRGTSPGPSFRSKGCSVSKLNTPVCCTDSYPHLDDPRCCKNCSTGPRSSGRRGRNPPWSLMNTTRVP
jgi:hypothetical protein